MSTAPELNAAAEAILALWQKKGLDSSSSLAMAEAAIGGYRAYLAALSAPEAPGVALAQVWYQNLCSFIEGRFPADERWKGIFLKELAALVATPPAPVDGNALLREIERLRPHYQSFTGTDRARRQMLDHFEQFAAALSRAKAGPAEPVDETLQARVQPWMMACFGREISADRVERGDRLLEEVFELLQSGGYDPARVLALRDYVWGRDAGEPFQEAGGVMITLAAYCLAHDLNMHDAGEVELARIWTKVDKIRAKQAAKPVGSALPVASPRPDAEQFPPTSCSAREDCKHDGLCHDPEGCGGIGPNSHQEARPDAGVVASPTQGMEDRKTFVVPDGFEAVFDDEGRATGQVRPRATALAPALAEPQGVERLHPRVPGQAASGDPLDWAVYKWHNEVANRPLQNVHRRSLDDTWRQVIRHFGGDAVELCGPAHDDLLAAAPEQEKSR